MMILGILGSGSKDSGTRRALDEVRDKCLAGGCSFDLLDLAVEFRDLHDVDVYDEPPADSQTAALRARVAAASAVVLATPVHHGSFSGLLKNALDHLLGDAMENKPVGLIAHGSGAKGTTVAAEHLRTVVRAMGGWSTPTSVSVVPADLADGVVKPVVSARMDALIGELTGFVNGALAVVPLRMMPPEPGL
jgi:NAD(P)H-dependent FMN reductase